MKKTARWAARSLPKGTRRQFVAAFAATGAMDLYDGDLGQYLQVIRQELDARARTLLHFERQRTRVLRALREDDA